MQTLLQSLLTRLQPGKILDVKLGLHWTAVTAQIGDETRTGLATTLSSAGHHHRDWPDVQTPGTLQHQPATALAALVQSRSPAERSIGLATINAMLPPLADQWVDLNAEEVIAQAGAGKNVALVGHFPFVQRLRPRVGQLWVLELEPRGEDIPAHHAPEIIPRADVLALTSVTLLNHTLIDLLEMRAPGALTLLLGPSTPLTPLLFDWGIDILSGAVVTNTDAVRSSVCQGAGFRQLHKAGIRLVTLRNPAT